MQFSLTLLIWYHFTFAFCQTYENINRFNLIDTITFQPCFNHDQSVFKLYKGSDYFTGQASKISFSGYFLFKGYLNDHVILSMYYQDLLSLTIKYSIPLTKISLILNDQIDEDTSSGYQVNIWFFIMVDVNYNEGSKQISCQARFFSLSSIKTLQVQINNWNTKFDMENLRIYLGMPSKSMNTFPSCLLVKNLYLYLDSQFDITKIAERVQYISSTNTYLQSHYDFFYTEANPGQLLSGLGVVQDRLLIPSKLSGTDDVDDIFSTDIINASEENGIIFTFHMKIDQFLAGSTACTPLTIFNNGNVQFIPLVINTSNEVSLNSSTQIIVDDITQWQFVTITIKKTIGSQYLYVNIQNYESQQLFQLTPLTLVKFVFGQPTNCSLKISNIRITQGTGIATKNYCDKQVLNAMPFCIQCKSNSILDYQNSSSCVDSSLPQTPYGTKMFIPPRGKCPLDMVNDENNPGECRCQFGFYKDIESNTCKKCNRYCDGCKDSAYSCLKQHSNRQNSGLCQAGYFDDGFSCIPSLLKIPLYIKFFTTFMTGCVNNGAAPTSSIISNSLLQANVGDSILFSYSVSILINSSYGQTQYPIGYIQEDGVTVMLMNILTNISSDYYVLQILMNGNLIRQLSPIKKDENIIIIYWTDNNNHIFLLNQLGQIEVVEISNIKIFNTYNIKICVGHCEAISLTDGCVKIVNRGFSFIKGIPYPTSKGIKELYFLFNKDKIKIGNYQVYFSFSAPIQNLLNNQASTDTTQYLHYVSPITYIMNKGISVSGTNNFGTISNLLSTDGILSFSCSFLIEQLQNTIYFLSYESQSVVVFELLLVPNNSLQEISIRICFYKQCRDTKYAKLDYGRKNLLLVISNYLTSFDAYDYQEFEVVCNQKREKMKFYAQFDYKFNTLTNIKIGYYSISNLPTQTISVYYNDLNFYQANAPFYFNYDESDPCFVYFGIVSMNCHSKKEVNPYPLCSLYQYNNGVYACLLCKDPNADHTLICSQCKPNYFIISNSLNLCQQCGDNCKDCSGNKDNCTACLQPNKVPPHCGCIDDTYYLDEQNLCQKCPANCLTCDDQGKCTSCKGLNRVPPDCNCDGQYKDQANVCVKRVCGPQCELCENSSNNCLKCSQNRINPPNCECGYGYSEMRDGTCAECEINTYYNEDVMMCMNCGLNCATCNNQECIQCMDGLVLSGQNCICRDSNQSYINNHQIQRCINHMNVQLTVSKADGVGYVLTFTFDNKLQLIDFNDNPFDQIISIYIPEISQKYYLIQDPKIKDNVLTVLLVPLQNFLAQSGIAIIQTNQYFLSEEGDLILNQKYVNVAQEFKIGPIVRNENEVKSQSLSDMSNSLTSMKQNDSGLFAFINGVQFVFYLLNTLQPCSQFLLLKAEFPSPLYQFYQVIGLFVYPDVPSFQSEPQDKSYHIFNYVLTEKEIKKPEDGKFQRLKFHTSIIVNIPIIIIKYISIIFIFSLVYFLSLKCVNVERYAMQEKIKTIKVILINRIDSENEVNILISMLCVFIQFSNVDQDPYLVRIGFYVSIMILMIHTFQFIFNYLNLNNYKNLDYSTQFHERTQSSNQESFLKRNYFLFQMLKKYLVTAVVYFFYEYPIVVCSTCAALFIFSGILTHYLKPYQDLKSRLVKGIGEMMIGIVWILHILIVVIEQSLEKTKIIPEKEISQYDKVGISIIIILLFFNCLFLFQFFFSLYVKIKPFIFKNKNDHKNTQQSNKVKEIITSKIYSEQQIESNVFDSQPLND